MHPALVSAAAAGCCGVFAGAQTRTAQSRLPWQYAMVTADEGNRVLLPMVGTQGAQLVLKASSTIGLEVDSFLDPKCTVEGGPLGDVWEGSCSRCVSTVNLCFDVMLNCRCTWYARSCKTSIVHQSAVRCFVTVMHPLSVTSMLKCNMLKGSHTVGCPWWSAKPFQIMSLVRFNRSMPSIVPSQPLGLQQIPTSVLYRAGSLSSQQIGTVHGKRLLISEQLLLVARDQSLCCSAREVLFWLESEAT